MAMLDDSEYDLLREIAERIRSRSDEAVYGLFCGGDPRLFSPDFEAATEAEIAQHKHD